MSWKGRKQPLEMAVSLKVLSLTDTVIPGLVCPPAWLWLEILSARRKSLRYGLNHVLRLGEKMPGHSDAIARAPGTQHPGKIRRRRHRNSDQAQHVAKQEKQQQLL